MSLQIQRKLLANGLRIIVHEDHTTPLAVCNVVYNVGSRDENPNHTGMAHLMEHFMFCGSKNVPNYDKEIQKIGAINNAYTSQDITNYYIVLPANNLEIAFWLESDRMLELAFRQKSLEIQKQVVIEEFKENYLNRPYGDMALLFNNLAYDRHPYKWLPIGKKTEHISEMTMDMIKKFFYTYYRPNNAVLVVAGNVHYEEVVSLAEKWFGDIPSCEMTVRTYPQELAQQAPKFLEVERNVPSDLLLKAWKMCGRKNVDYYAFDLLSDMFGTGQSSYLYRKLVIEDAIFTDISASVMGTADPGLFIIDGRPAENVSIEQADAALCDFLYNFQYDNNLPHDLQKVKNRAESVLLSNDIKIDDRASTIAVAEILGGAEYFLDDRQHYFDVTEEQIQHITKQTFTENLCSTLYYKKGK